MAPLIGVYEKAVELGLRFPLHSFLVIVLNLCGIFLALDLPQFNWVYLVFHRFMRISGQVPFPSSL